MHLKYACVFFVLNLVDSNEGQKCTNEFPWDDARLPQTVHPVHYDLVVHPNLTEFTFRGSVNILLNATDLVEFVILNVVDLDMENIRLRSSDGRAIGTATKSCPDREQLAVLPLEEEELGIPSGSYNLSMTFRGKLTDTLRGLYRSSYIAENGARKYMAVTQFSPTDARRMFPCFDEPLFKATFRTSIIRDANTISLSNMPISHSELQADNLVKDNFETTLKMSTYLIAVVVFDFPKMTKITKDGVQVSLYAPQIQINQTEFALDVAVDSLEFHEEFLKIPFPLRKLDIVAIGDFAFGAMENWGLMTFRDTIILYDPEKSSSTDEDYLTGVVSHEIGHQWFGNLATMKWWADLWLKEGFARFLETYAASKIRPTWGLLDLFGPNVINLAYNLDGLNNTHSIYVPVGETSEIRGIFDAISYNKGASIIFMLMNILGEENMTSGLNDYLKTYQYSNADGWEFWEILAKHATNLGGQRLDEIADTWTLQPGYPYLTVSANKSGLVLNQKRFYYLKKFAQNRNTQKWDIPFTYATDSGENALICFNTTDHIVHLQRPIKRWFKANTNGTGFYRILYKPRIWRALSKRLNQNVQTFSTDDRSNLIMDAFGFVRAGLLNISLAFDLIKYLPYEMEYGPWKAALDALDNIGYIHISTSIYDQYTNHVRSLLEPLYNNITWTLPDDHKEKRFRSKILASACQYNVGDCRSQAVSIFRNWAATNATISPDLLQVVMTSAIMTNPDENWDLVWTAYMDSIYPSEKTNILEALCSTPKEDQILELLNASLDPRKIRANLLPTVALNVATNPSNGMRLLWSFTKENWSRIYKVAGGTAVLGNYLSSSLSSFSDQSDLDEISSFFSTRDVNGAKRSLDQALENIEINIQWRELNDHDLERYVIKFINMTTSTKSYD